MKSRKEQPYQGLPWWCQKVGHLVPIRIQNTSGWFYHTCHWDWHTQIRLWSVQWVQKAWSAMDKRWRKPRWSTRFRPQRAGLKVLCDLFWRPAIGRSYGFQTYRGLYMHRSKSTQRLKNTKTTPYSSSFHVILRLNASPALILNRVEGIESSPVVKVSCR